jgi:RimJ/RimL family protein N-acetyltransferase
MNKYLLRENLYIQPCQTNNAEDIARLQTKMAKETEDYDLDATTVLEGVKALIADPNKGTYYKIINEDEQILGCILITKEWSDWRNGYVLWIQSLFLETELRSKGLFSLIYKFFQKQVKDQDNLKGIRLYVDKTNLRAVKVYEAIGMSNEHYEMFEWIP